MEKINVYDLLSKCLECEIGDTCSKKQNISTLFIDGLFSDEFEEMKFKTIEGEGGLEYHAEFDGHNGMGKTPALSLKNLLQEVVNGLYFAENGRP